MNVQFLRIETIAERKLVGDKVSMSFAADRTFELWRSFMPRRKEIENALTTALYCVQEYSNAAAVLNFDPVANFTKWAAVEVSRFDSIPGGMDTLTMPGGLYAVFFHKGAAATAAQTFGYIFREWLPASGYKLDNRPHFEVLGAKYKNNDPESEEEVWIPIRRV